MHCISPLLTLQLLLSFRKSAKNNCEDAWLQSQKVNPELRNVGPVQILENHSKCNRIKTPRMSFTSLTLNYAFLVSKTKIQLLSIKGLSLDSAREKFAFRLSNGAIVCSQRRNSLLRSDIVQVDPRDRRRLRAPCCVAAERTEYVLLRSSGPARLALHLEGVTFVRNCY